MQAGPGLPTTQAENLLEPLGNRDLVFPRLQIPFPQWGALLELAPALVLKTAGASGTMVNPALLNAW
ncbi:hypothetical protein NIES2101_25740 [Calothrix sp. HK-06]|nr:hypothetical protein NIES2101_25740 [Calothrix sp. HK-06]